MLHDVAGLHARGDLDGALALCREMLRRRPDMPLGLSRLAFLLREKGDLAGAVEALQKAFSLDPSDTDTLAVLAAYLNEAGRHEETVALLEPHVREESPDLDVLIAYGVALAQSRRFAEAHAAFARARELDPSHAMALVNTATVHMMTGDHDAATGYFNAALTRDPNNYYLRALEGWHWVQAGDLHRAKECFEHSIKIRPWDNRIAKGYLLRVDKLIKAEESQRSTANTPTTD